MKIPVSCVYARLPRAGLGNKLFVWARAWVFAHQNDLPLLISMWGQVKLGPLLRGERHSRAYWGYFGRPGIAELLAGRAALALLPQEREPSIRKLSPIERSRRRLYVFDQLPDHRDYFWDLKPYRSELMTAMFAMLTPRHRRLLSTIVPGAIHVHVRMGDFRPLRPGEVYGAFGHVRVPLEYYAQLVRAVRAHIGFDAHVRVFSDGHDHELQELLNLPNVSRFDSGSDVVDLISLARCRVLITTPSSTYSYWAAFLSDRSVVVHHPAHFFKPMRPECVTSQWFEGAVDPNPTQWPELLRQNLASIGADLDQRMRTSL